MKLFAFMVFLILFSVYSYSDVQTPIYDTYEMSFISDTIYDNTYLETELFCRFISPSNIEYNVGGFWDGGRKFKVRFLPNEIGIWTYQTTFSDKSNIKLHNAKGLFNVIENSKSNEFTKHGLLKIDKDSRVIKHEDNTPFFMINDVAWRISYKSTPDQIYKYISDRKSKGFNTFSMVIVDDLNKRGWYNPNKDTMYVDTLFNEINPKYFQYIDFIVKTANDSGITAMITPLWCNVAEVNYDSVYNPVVFPIDKSLLFAKYFASRMSGYNVIWIVAGDGDYEREDRKAFWRKFGRTLKKYGGVNHLTTCHTHGYSGSYIFFDQTDEWLDFYSYHSSHVINIDYTWIGGKHGYNVIPIKPNFSIEPAFEDMINEFWNPDANRVRIEDHHVRKAHWESILSGGLVGFSYGANGIFNWNTPEQPGWFDPRYYILDACKLPASNQLRNGSLLLKKLGWPNLVPKFDFKLTDTSNLFVITAQNLKGELISYVPRHKGEIHFNLEKFINKDLMIKWINPVTLEELKPIYFKRDTSNYSNVKIMPPDTNDWVLVMNEYDINDTNDQIEKKDFSVYPNPSNDFIRIEFKNDEERDYTVRIYNMLGEIVFINNVTNPINNIIRVDLNNLNNGAYIVETVSGTKRFKQLIIKN